MGPPSQPRGPDDLDDQQRARIRRQVLGSVRPLRRTFADRLGDRLYDVFAVLAVPAPHIVRAVAVAAVVVSIVGTATVASADALPEEPLFAVKVAGEQVRLALARMPEDRAAVELSMAEHRLSEAERLAQGGRQADALVATSAYGTHLANAAAELAAIERLNAGAKPVVEGLKQRLAHQQQRAADVAARFVGDAATGVGAQLFKTVASFAPALPSGSTVSEGIAVHAANIAGQLAVVAQRLAEEAEAAEAAVEDEEEEEEGAKPPPAPPAPAAEPARAPAAVPARATPRPTEAPRATAAPRRTPSRPTSTPAAVGAVRGPEATKAAATPKPTAKPKATVDPKKAADTLAAKAALEKAKREAENARHAAEKAKEAAKKTPTPKPSPKR
ncbi:MAG: hypothetical protein HYU87_04755 [Chloroflexi bacterium]|nr:hypothetical protein [Chloroflexota bacterium]